MSEQSERQRDCIQSTFEYTLTIPLLANRLPLPSVTQLSSRLPINHVDLLTPDIETFVSSLTQDSRIHLLANVLMFAPPRYSTFSGSALDSYLVLLSSLLGGLPTNAFELSPEKNIASTWLQNTGNDSSESDADMEEDSTLQSASDAQTRNQPARVSITLDSKTRARMQTLISQKHMHALLQVTGKHQNTRNQFFRFILSLCHAWPAQSEKAIHAVFSVTGYGFMREIYRGFVRSSPIGKSDDLSSLTGMWLFIVKSVIFRL